MAWIESHQEIAHHPKLGRLMRALGISRPTAIGLLHLLWWWAMDHAPTGDLARYDADDLADAVDWQGDPTLLLTALTRSGFLDAEPLALHDWAQYAGKLLESRAAARERMASVRARSPNLPDRSPNVPVNRTGTGTGTGTGAAAGIAAAAARADRAPVAPAVAAPTAAADPWEAFRTRIPTWSPGATAAAQFAERLGAGDYAPLDLAAEADAIRLWLDGHPRQRATDKLVLAWLERSRAQLQHEHDVASRPYTAPDYSEFWKTHPPVDPEGEFNGPGAMYTIWEDWKRTHPGWWGQWRQAHPIPTQEATP